MNRYKAPRLGRLIIAVGKAVGALCYALFAGFLQLAAAKDDEPDDDRRIYDAETAGEYNYRTRKFDAGADPYGWYARDED